MTRREALLERLQQIGGGPKRSLGQNFLISDGVIERILLAACDGSPSSVIEIGPGLGALTEGLLEFTRKRHRPFRVIELDREFSDYWRKHGVEVIEADALQLDWQALKLPPDSRLVSNLPYQISSSLVIDRSVNPAGISSMILMFQKEVAKRIAAKPSTPDYGLLSVIAQIGWRVDIVSEAGPGDFYPPPRVASRVLRFRRLAEAPPQDEFARFLMFSKAAYSHRRKLMVRNLESFGDATLSRARIEQELESLGHSKMARAEELAPETMLKLYRALASIGAGETRLSDPDRNPK